MSEYVVLQNGTGAGWVELARVEARSAIEAIKKNAKAGDGIYNAVPARSWNPIKIKAKVETTYEVIEV